jgi:hypothetical protein
MTEDVVKRLKPIPPDPEMEKMDKKSMAYRYKQRRLACILCVNTATQMLVYELEGCTKIERYCDGCASKIINQSTSGI